jgi:hypothetical protein
LYIISVFHHTPSHISNPKQQTHSPKSPFMALPREQLVIMLQHQHWRYLRHCLVLPSPPPLLANPSELHCIQQGYHHGGSAQTAAPHDLPQGIAPGCGQPANHQKDNHENRVIPRECGVQASFGDIPAR